MYGTYSSVRRGVGKKAYFEVVSENSDVISI